MMKRTSSGVALKRRLMIIELTLTDFPEPVVPAMRRWGMRARSAAKGIPSMSLPMPMVSFDFDLRKASCSSTSRR
jgi:hypothetical protein